MDDGVLRGKVGLVFGVANQRSIAWGIALLWMVSFVLTEAGAWIAAGRFGKRIDAIEGRNLADARSDYDRIAELGPLDWGLGLRVNGPLADRLEMCRFAFSRLGPRASVVDLESGLPTPSYTVQTLRALHHMRPGIRPLWVAGADLLDELHRWQEPEEVERLAELFLVPRPGYDDKGRARLDFALAELSSRDLRARLAAGEDVPGSLDAAVRAFILARNLYRTRP